MPVCGSASAAMSAVPALRRRWSPAARPVSGRRRAAGARVAPGGLDPAGAVRLADPRCGCGLRARVAQHRRQQGRLRARDAPGRGALRLRRRALRLREVADAVLPVQGVVRGDGVRALDLRAVQARLRRREAVLRRGQRLLRRRERALVGRDGGRRRGGRDGSALHVVHGQRRRPSGTARARQGGAADGDDVREHRGERGRAEAVVAGRGDDRHPRVREVLRGGRAPATTARRRPRRRRRRPRRAGRPCSPRCRGRSSGRSRLDHEDAAVRAGRGHRVDVERRLLAPARVRLGSALVPVCADDRQAAVRGRAAGRARTGSGRSRGPLRAAGSE